MLQRQREDVGVGFDVVHIIITHYSYQIRWGHCPAPRELPEAVTPILIDRLRTKVSLETAHLASQAHLEAQHRTFQPEQLQPEQTS